MTSPGPILRPTFQGLTGRGIKIAVIDSGVNNGHPHILRPACKLSFCSEADEGSPGEDRLGHGTAVMAAIQEKAPDADYYALKVFGTALRTTGARLVEALQWTIDNRMDIVNLSLGTPNTALQEPLFELTKRAQNVGVLFISSRYCGEASAFPGSLDGVIGVDVDWDLSRDSYQVKYIDERLAFVASGFPRPLPGMPPWRNLHGVSFAVANMTGLVARACEQSPRASFDEICTILLDEGRRHEPARDRQGADSQRSAIQAG